MATASAKMTADLIKDYVSVGEELAKMEKKIGRADAGAAGTAVDSIRTAHTRLKPQIQKFAQGLKGSPQSFPEEEDYKARRKDVTKLMAAAKKTAKAVTAWSKSAGGDDDVVTVECFSDGVSEVTGSDKKMAQALTMVANGEQGRSGPKQSGVGKYQHIHVGGNARMNLLFTPAGVVLGIIDFHMDKKNNDSQKENIKKVATRKGGKVTLKIEGQKVSRA